MQTLSNKGIISADHYLVNNTRIIDNEKEGENMEKPFDKHSVVRRQGFNFASQIQFNINGKNYHFTNVYVDRHNNHWYHGNYMIVPESITISEIRDVQTLNRKSINLMSSEHFGWDDLVYVYYVQFYDLTEEQQGIIIELNNHKFDEKGFR